MNIEGWSQHLKSRLLRHSIMLLALLFTLLALLLFLTSLLSQATTLSDLFVDIAIYTIYILLVLVLGSIAFVGYCRVEEPLIGVDSYISGHNILEIDNIVKPLSDQDEKTVNDPDYSAVINSSKARLPSLLDKPMPGFEVMESSTKENIAEYLSRQHPQIAAVILLIIDVEKAVTVLEHFETSYRESVLSNMEEIETVSKESLKVLDEALQMELLALPKECATLRELGAAEIRAILRRIDKKELMFALKGATQELQEKFFVNMSSKASSEFKKAMAAVSSVEQTKSQNAIRNLYLLAEQLRDNGKICATNKTTG
jgi:hypothetical protein